MFEYIVPRCLQGDYYKCTMVASLGYLNYPIVPCTLVLTGSQESHQEFANYSQCNSIFFFLQGWSVAGPYGSVSGSVRVRPDNIRRQVMNQISNWPDVRFSRILNLISGRITVVRPYIWITQTSFWSDIGKRLDILGIWYGIIYLYQAGSSNRN